MENNSFRISFIVGVLTICVIALVVVCYDSLTKVRDSNLLVRGEDSQTVSTEDIYLELENNFQNIFNNTLNNNNPDIVVNKIDQGKDIVYTAGTIKENKSGFYDVNAKIPAINIQNQVIARMNKEIEDIFKQKATSVLTINNSESYTLYNVDYIAYINGDILSLAIRATLKEGSNIQRLILKTYNYDLVLDKAVTLKEVIEQKGLQIRKVQDDITEKIQEVSRSTANMGELGYNVFPRNSQDEMYYIENTENFFIGKDGYLYVLYPYGNLNTTSEIDIVIF